ncbi:MAG: restriction endonuclease subunit S [Candidatus Nitrosocaldus sp.]
MSMQEDNLPRLPDGWVWVRLGDICLDPQYGWTTRAKTNGTLHLLRTTDITSGQINWNNVPFCEIEPPEPAKYLLNDGDILISRAGSIGSSIMIKNPPLAIFASYLIRFRTLIDVSYLAYFLQSPLYWKSISEKKIGITIPNINATKLKQIMVPLPPLQEQKRIVEEIERLFSIADHAEKIIEHSLAQADRLRQSILKKAFEGKLVPQDPTDEPASMLLEKIKLEKATKIKSSNNRRSINNNHDNNSSNYDHVYMADLRMEKYEYDGKRMMAKGRTKRGGRGKGRGRRRKRYTVMDDEHQMRLI